jgi:hypothetical protein
VIDVGDYFSLITLDSGHVAEPAGAQRDWLETTLEQRQGVTHLVAAWHVHMFPAKRPFGLPSSEAIREPWLPLFDRFGVDLGLEHHENTYKRTYPIRDGQIDPTGTVFIGNGGFSEIEGRMPEPPGNWSTGGRWYLQKSAYSNYFAVIELNGLRMTIEARTPAGHVLDRVAFISGMHKPVDFAHLGSSFWPTVIIAAVAAATAFGGALFFVRRRS